MDLRIKAIDRRMNRRWVNLSPRSVCLVLLFVFPLGAQTSGRSGGQISLPQPIGQQPVGGLDDVWGNNPAEQQKRQRDINAARQKTIVSDTEKLLKLAAALKAETESPDSAQNLPQQMSQWGQIERLARGIKERMSYAASSPSGYIPYGSNH